MALFKKKEVEESLRLGSPYLSDPFDDFTFQHTDYFANPYIHSALSVIDNTISPLPIHLFKSVNDSAEKVTNHSVSRIFAEGPNWEMTWQGFMSYMVKYYESYGVAYAEIIKSRTGIQELWPINPQNINEERLDNGRIKFTFIPTNKPIKAENLLRIKNPATNGNYNITPINICKKMVKFANTVHNFHEQFYEKNIAGAGYLSSDANLKDEDKIRFAKQYQKARTKGETPFADQGVKFNPFGQKLSDQQVIETEKEIKTQIALIFNLKPFMLGVMDNMNYSNLESIKAEAYQTVWLPRLKMWEKTFNKCLLTQSEREKGYYIEINMDGLLRSDILKRHEIYRIGTNIGMYNANDCLAMENRPKQNGKSGDTYTIPMNMMNKDDLLQNSEKSEKKLNPIELTVKDNIKEEVTLTEHTILQKRDSIVRNYESKLSSVFNELLDKDSIFIESQIRNLSTFGKDKVVYDIQQYLKNRKSEIYKSTFGVYSEMGKNLIDFTEQELGTELNRFDLDNKINKYVESFSGRYVSILVAKANKLKDDEAYYEDKLFIEAKDKTSLLDEEKVRFKNAVVRSAYLGAGVVAYKSISSGNSCPMCSKLDGIVVDMDKPIVAKGEGHDIGGGKEFVSTTERYHPPYHRGCSCGIVAVKY